jgi:hypothetical protein
MPRRSSTKSKGRRALYAALGGVVGILVVVAGFGLWSVVAPGAAVDFCDAGLILSGGVSVSEPSPQYDEQAILFDPISSASVSSSVNVSSQTDAQGYGAAFLANAESSAGYWYQVGVAFDWGWGSGYLPGFVFIYSMYAPGTPSNSPTSICMVRADLLQNEPVLLAIAVSSGTVLVSLSQPSVGLLDSALFSSYGASTLEGTSGASPSGFFTGWMTEWRHAATYYGPSANAAYSIQPSQSTAYFAIGEYDTSNGDTVFGQVNEQPLNCGCTQSFSYEGVTETASATEFTTG